MTNRYFNIFLIILFIILLFSCVSSSETKYQKTSKLREKVEKYNLKKYAEEEYNKAEEEYQEAKKLFDSKKKL